MKTPIDIVEIKKAVKDGLITVFVKDNIIYLRNKVGECVAI
jgi:hypothetical protein